MRIAELLVNATSKVSRYLNRDLSELVHLQNNQRKDHFVAKSYTKAKETITSELEEKFEGRLPKLSFHQVPPQGTEGQTCIFIELLEGNANFTHAIPYFGNVLTFAKYQNGDWKGIASVVDMPGLMEVIWTQHNFGAQKKAYSFDNNAQSRLRCSHQQAWEDAFVISFTGKVPAKHIRYFGSNCASLSLVLNGQADAVIATNLHIATKLAFELFAQEALGQYSNHEGKHIVSGRAMPTLFKS